MRSCARWLPSSVLRRMFVRVAAQQLLPAKKGRDAQGRKCRPPNVVHQPSVTLGQPPPLQLEMPRPMVGVVPGVANPMRFFDTLIKQGNVTLLCGQHTNEVLQALSGHDDTMLNELRKRRCEQWRVASECPGIRSAIFGCFHDRSSLTKGVLR